MEEINLQSKAPTIKYIFKEIINVFSADFFDFYYIDNKKYIVDFWEADLYAIGLKAKDKVIYISTWDFRNNSLSDMNYYYEFEVIDENNLDTLKIVKICDKATKEELLVDIEDFLHTHPHV